MRRHPFSHPFRPTAPATVPAARWAVAAIFFINGAVLGSWAPLIPLVQQKLGLSTGQLGVCLLAAAIGAIIAMPVAGGIAGRAGSAPVVRVSTVCLCTAILLPSLAPHPVLLFIALLAIGASNGAMDVSMNAHGIAVEQALGRPVMSSYHAMFSLGGFAGALGGAALLRLAEHPFAEAAVIGAGLGLCGLVVFRFLLPGSVDAGGPGHAYFALPTGLALILGALCFLVMMAEGSMLDWTAVYLHRDLGANPSLAALGYSAFSIAMAAGRFMGDWLRQKSGAAALVSVSAAVAAAGVFLAVIFPDVRAAVLGFGLCGLGLSNTVPVLYSAAGRLPGTSAGSGVAAVATLGYAGFLAGPPLIGFTAQGISLAFGLGLVGLGCVVVMLSARPIVSRSEPAAPHPRISSRESAGCEAN
ncbi:MAG: MFS transporter [Verrucomicrobia bacterium]|nr:MFS transporter [Verrucomicrobiota bacterium]